MSKNKRALLLASGSGSIGQSIIDAVESGLLNLDLIGLISDKDSAALERAKRHGIAAFFLPVGADRAAWNQKLFELVASLNPDIVISVGFMRVLDEKFVTSFRTINTHPALLPLFPGAHAVRDALAAGAKETGSTIHWVDKGVDTGPIIDQVRIPILDTDDEETLHERIKIAERILVVETLAKLLTSGVI